jgi:hypothetical protein
LPQTKISLSEAVEGEPEPIQDAPSVIELGQGLDRGLPLEEGGGDVKVHSVEEVPVRRELHGEEVLPPHECEKNQREVRGPYADFLL